MNDLNTFIDTTRQFSAPADAIPVIDRSPHVSLGLELAQRAAQQQQQQPAPPVQMTPIVAVAS